MSIGPGIRCRNCQSWNRPGALFCAGCGARLPVEPPAVPIEAPPRPYPPTASIEATPRPYPPVEHGRRAAPPRRTHWLALSANVLAWLAGLAAAVLICLALPILSASDHLMDSQLYKESLREQDVYQRFPDLFAEQMMLSQPSLGRQAHIDFNGVGPADWKILAQALFPPDWIQTQVERLLDEIFAAAKPGVTPPALKISLADITQRLGDESGMRIYKQVIQTKRECNFDDFFSIMDWINEDPAALLPICNIPADLSEFAAWIGGYNSGDEMIRGLLKMLPDQLPKEIELSEFMELRTDRLAGWLRAGRIAGWICLALAGLSLLFTFAAPLGRTLSGGLLLWGLPLALAGAAGLLEALLLPWAVGGLITSGFKGTLAPSLSSILLQMGEAVAKSSATALAWQGGGLLTLGGLLCGAAALVWGYRRLKPN